MAAHRQTWHLGAVTVDEAVAAFLAIADQVFADQQRRLQSDLLARMDVDVDDLDTMLADLAAEWHANREARAAQVRHALTPMIPVSVDGCTAG